MKSFKKIFIGLFLFVAALVLVTGCEPKREALKFDGEEVGVHYPTKFITPICKKPIFQIGDKVQNKQTGYINVIKHINDKNYMFVDGIYIFDNEDGFAIKKQHEWRKI